MAESSHGAPITLSREQDYRFRVRFPGGVPELMTDEAPPVGGGTGPAPTALLAAAVANCLASSLMFCLAKQRIELASLDASVVLSTTRNDEGRLRVAGIEVSLSPEVTSAEDRERMSRCLELFESFCVVTESVRHGIPIGVGVEPRVRS